MREGHRAQRGIAVITVLLALAIAVVITSEVIMRVYAGVKRSQNQFNTQQAWQYALGGEAWARQVLIRDLQKNRQVKVDHLYEDWARPAQRRELDSGWIEIEIYDMQSRFNLNNLVNEQGAVVPADVQLFNRLLGYLGVRPAYADLAARWASYADDTDNLYNSDKIPHRAADTQFGSVTELRLLRDIEMQEYRRIEPFVAALPVPVTININTASEPVLAGLANIGGQSAERLRAFLQRREQMTQGFTTPDAFINAMGIQDNETAERIGVSSQYFEVRVIAEYAGRRVWLSSVLFRDEETEEISLLTRDSSLRFDLGLPDVPDKADDAGTEREKRRERQERKAQDKKDR